MASYYNEMEYLAHMKLFVRLLYLVVFLGFLNVLFSYLSGAIMTITVIGLPLGKGLWQLARFFFNPQDLSLVPAEKPKAKEHELWRLFGIFLWIIYLPLAIFLTLLSIVQATLLILSWYGRSTGKKIFSSLGSIFYPVDRVVAPFL